MSMQLWDRSFFPFDQSLCVIILLEITLELVDSSILRTAHISLLCHCLAQQSPFATTAYPCCVCYTSFYLVFVWRYVPFLCERLPIWLGGMIEGKQETYMHMGTVEKGWNTRGVYSTVWRGVRRSGSRRRAGGAGAGVSERDPSMRGLSPEQGRSMWRLQSLLWEGSWLGGGGGGGGVHRGSGVVMEGGPYTEPAKG